MIVKILGSSGSDFHGVNYNDKKVAKGTGELMTMKNFPSFINEATNQQQIRNYFKSISKNEKIKKPQFHAVISTKFKEHNKEELTKIAENFMDEMGYGGQPFIVVFHKDTENNHIHIVSTRVDKQTGKKINDSYEKLKAQKALASTLEKLYTISTEEALNKLLNYKKSSISQLETLLNRNGFTLGKNTNDAKFLTILKNGVIQRKLLGDQLVFDKSKYDNRTKQLRAILQKYKNAYSNKVFKVEDFRKQEAMFQGAKQKNDDWIPKNEFESELQKKLRDVFGIDLVFHHKNGLQPFGYTVIDHKTSAVFKGSEIMKMKELFEFTSEKMDKKLFESLKDYNVPNEEIKIVLQRFLKTKYQENEVMDFMLFENKKLKTKEKYGAIRNDVKEYLKRQNKEGVNIINSENGKYYVIHARLHYIGELEPMIGEKKYKEFLSPQLQNTQQKETKEGSEFKIAVNELIFELMKSSGTTKDPAENEPKKRRKKRSR